MDAGTRAAGRDARPEAPARPEPGRPKRILGVVGSLRPGGNSEMLVRVALQAAAERGAETAVVFLRDLRIDFCDGCLTCVFHGGRCRRDDDVSWFYETAASYDGIIVASPTYLLGAPGQVKALIDRGVAEHAKAPGRREVPVGVACVAGLPGWDYLVRPMVNQLALLLGGRLVGSIMAYAPGPAEVLLDAEIVRQTRELALAVLEDRPLPAPPGVCPVCYLPRPERAQSSEREGGATEVPTGPCPFCLYDPARPDRPHRFSASSLAHFLVDWMLPSRERFLAHRDAVRRARADLPSAEIGVLRPPPVGAAEKEEGDGRP